MMFDDDLPRPKPDFLKPRPLDGVSRDDLTEYLQFLEAEKIRTESAIAAKGDFSGEAEKLFRR